MSSCVSGTRKHPPDKPTANLEEKIPSPKEAFGESGSSVAEQGNEASAEQRTEERGKVRKTDGGFSGDTSMAPREEPWMTDQEGNGGRPASQVKSYREAVKPTSPCHDGDEYDVLEDDWDGNLITSRIEDMVRGVSITETEQGIHISFSEEEKARLNRKWKSTLIVKLVGGSIGYMQLKRRLMNLWKVQGRLELSCLGNGYLLASLSSMDDYYFALEGGPWIIQNHYLMV